MPTVGGVLLFGHDRLAHFPDAWVQVGRFAGIDRSRIVDQTEIRSPLFEAVPEVMAFVEKHGLHGVSIGAVRHTSVRSLPPVAVREALVNVLVHADYAQHGAPVRVALFDDRLEIENPGLLPFGLTLDDLPRGVSKLRNRVLGRTFKELGLVEQWGSGVQRMIGACREAGLPPPEWEEIGTRLRVTLRTGANGTITLDPKDAAILDRVSYRFDRTEPACGHVAHRRVRPRASIISPVQRQHRTATMHDTQPARLLHDPPRIRYGDRPLPCA